MGHSKKQTQSTPQPTPARNSAGSRSGPLKRVAFKDEQTVHDDGASSVRLIPSTSDLSDGDQPATPVPAPPPGYESRDPGFAPITDADTQLLPPSSSNTSKQKSHQDNIQCSTTMTTT